MSLPLIPIAAGSVGVAAGVAINAWLTGKSDPWEDKDVFNARMRDMQSLAMALNDGFSTCPAIRNSQAQLTSWRGARDGFSKFYGDVGTLVYSGPNNGQIDQAKAYASKFYFWTGEFSRLKCGGNISPYNPNNPTAPVDPYNPTPNAPTVVTDWAGIVKWSAIGIGGAFLLKTLTNLFRTYKT